MAVISNRKLNSSPTTAKKMRSPADKVRQLCRERWRMLLDESAAKCAQTRLKAEISRDLRARLDCRAAMLQAIRIGREIPMLEPWIIDEIRRREEDRRRGDLPRLEIPMPQSWEDDRNLDGVRDKQEDGSPERGVVIIGM
jgi:hypothetical protein